MKRRDMKLLLEERFERIALLETRIDTMDQLVEGYRVREQSIFDTLSAAKENATKMLERAKAEGAQIRAEAEAVLQDAEQVRLSARAEAEALLADAIHTANTLKAEAEKKGNEMTATIKADSERMLRDAEIIKREYEEMVDSFNAMLEQNASELEITAARFGEFVKNRKIDRTEARLDGNAFYKSVGEMSDANLPDASGDPSLLMQNIYRIQNRPLPEDRIETPAQAEEAAPKTQEAPAQKPEFPMEDGNGADERQVAEPYSEQAWANESQESESEPQAEFTRVYNDDYAKTDYTVQSEECAVTQEDAKYAFDEIVSGQEPAGDAAAAAIPLGSAALAADIAEKPLSDVSRAMDEYFDKAFDPDGKIAQDAEPQEAAQGAENNSPEQAEVTASEQPDASKVAPEPYSEQAWVQSSFASDHEPQAEGALFADANAYADETAKQAAYAPAPVSASEVDSALDDYLAQLDAFVPTAPNAPVGATPPEPYSEQAWAQSATTSEHEPQAEGALFVDTFTFTPESLQTKLPEDAIPSGEPVLASDVDSAFDDYLSQIGDIPNVAPTAAAAAEPYSELAWAQSSVASGHEPQAEGALFGDIDSYLNDSLKQNDSVQAAVPVYETAVASGDPVSANEAESAFDDYLAQSSSDIPAAPTTPIAPEPYSEQAWAQSAAVSEYEPQAEGALFGDIDSYLNDSLKQKDGFKASAFVPEVAPAVEAPFAGGEPVLASEAESAFDDYLAQSNSDIPAVPTTPVAPEPYSEQAWAQSAAMSAYEPQAEGDSLLSGIAEEEEEPEPAPAPRRYNEYGEIREWEPEPEPDMEDIPTVSRFMGESGGSDEISLDQLLDEIIKAGE
ncbi:MAG TPA: hypothetical protein PKA81_12105 [Clostridia bacterium]|nr:hypothetical protein [Clostridia bacterium]